MSLKRKSCLQSKALLEFQILTPRMTAPRLKAFAEPYHGCVMPLAKAVEKRHVEEARGHRVMQCCVSSRVPCERGALCFASEGATGLGMVKISLAATEGLLSEG